MADDAQWQHLPHDPVSFFGLGEGFDRKDLKRAYTRLIRRYKPERAPTEFKRIRAAFEDLDDRLRYDRPVGPGTLPAMADVLGEDVVPPPPSPAEGAEARVRGEGPVQLRASLEAAAGEDARTWCALALLDTVLEEDPLAPMRRLLDGIDRATHPRACAELLEQLARDPMEPKHAKGFIELMIDAVAKGRGERVGLADGFWYLTELHWLQLARRAEPASFQAFFDRARTRLAGAVQNGEPVVLARLFRVLCLRADEGWLSALSRDIQEEQWRTPGWVEQEFDLADWLARYRYVREAFVDGDELRDLMDEAIRAIVEEDEVAADRAFLRAQVECAERKDELLESLPARRDGQPGAVAAMVPLEILRWYGDEWRERWLDDDEEGETTRARRALEFARRLDRRTDRSLAGWGWQITFLVSLGTATALCAGVGVLLKPTIGAGAFAVAGVLIASLWGALFTGKLWKIVVWLSRPFSWRQHRTLWRPMVAAFLEEQHMGVDELLASFMADESPAGYHEIFFVGNDQGLRALGEALRVTQQ